MHALMLMLLPALLHHARSDADAVACTAAHACVDALMLSCQVVGAVLPATQFRPISEVGNVDAGGMVDVIGVVQSCDNWQPIMRRNGEETRKRSLVLRDASGGSVELTLWGQMTSDPGDALHEMVASGDHPVLAVKNARVGDFNGKVRARPTSPPPSPQPYFDAAEDAHSYIRSVFPDAVTSNLLLSIHNHAKECNKQA
eukprot:360820-Chlamydomonas_euryale.AAC.1